jgi:hypothetical protein
MKMNTKTCSKCKELKDINEYIKKCGMCKSCRTIHRKEYREKNKEKFKEKDKKHYEKYKDEKRKQQAEYYKQNKTDIQNKRKIYRENNIEKHREKCREYYHSNLNRRLALICRNRIRREIKSGKKYLEYLGCTIDNLKNWFEYNFNLDNLTWDDYNKLWEIDHVIPCATFNMQSNDDVYKCFNWKNTKPVSKHLNRTKNSNILPFQIFEQELRLYIFQRQILN